ncbi:MAG: transcriptional regulator, partial [Propionibacteriaceae bacterium]|nr:transcriptional regulator [Propionibacteriaceae bacterium]
MTTTTPACRATDQAAVCPQVGGDFDEQAAVRLAQGFKALADPTRLHLLSLIAASPAQEACICHLIEPIGLSQA